MNISKKMFSLRVVKPWHVLLSVGYVQFVTRKGVDLVFVQKGVKSYKKGKQIVKWDFCVK